MLHVLWMILKILLILLGIVLGLILLALALLLFCPVRYRADAVKSREQEFPDTEASVAVSWLFGGIRLRGIYAKRNLDFEFCLFGMSLSRLMDRFTKKKSKTSDKTNKSMPEKEAKASTAAIEEKKRQASPEPIKTERLDTESEISERIDTPDNIGEEKHVEESEKTIEIPESRKSEKVIEIQETKPTKIQKEAKESKKPKEAEPPKKTKKSLGERLSGFRTKIRSVKFQADWWKSFLGDPRVKNAISLILHEAKHLLKHVFPTQLWGGLTIGFEDPSTTGKVLGIFGMTVPFHKNRVHLHSLWNEGNAVYGDLHLKGRVYGIVVVVAALKILLSKNIRYTRSRFKHKEEYHGRKQ